MNPKRLPLNNSIEARRHAAALIEAGKPFSTGGSLCGKVGDPPNSTGSLPEKYVQSARNAQYLIYSYDTPIAWLTVNGTWLIPEEFYSATTTKHQGMTRVWLLPSDGGNPL